MSTAEAVTKPLFTADPDPLKDPPKFEFVKRAPGIGMGTFVLNINGKPVCDCTSWVFESCGIDSFQAFKNYSIWKRQKLDEGYPNYEGVLRQKEKAFSNYDALEAYHDALFTWLETHSAYVTYQPKEYYLCIATYQVKSLPKMLSHPKVKLVDQFTNKSHGPSDMFLYRISLQKDFPKWLTNPA